VSVYSANVLSLMPLQSQVEWNLNLTHSACVVDFTDDCARWPCRAGGTCKDLGVLSYNCSCADGFTGGGLNTPCRSVLAELM
jgi:hypothetical protein